MKKFIFASASIFLLVSSGPKNLSFAHSEQQEQVEQGESSQTREQIEALEEKILGSEAHQKLEFIDPLVEQHPVLTITFLIVIIGGLVFIIRFFLLRKKQRSNS